MIFPHNKFVRKSCIVNIRQDSKYAIASGRYWQEKLIVKKNSESHYLLFGNVRKKMLSYSEAYLEPSRTSAIELLTILVEKLHRRYSTEC